MLEKEILDLVPEGQDVSIEREVFPKLVGNGLYSRRLEGYWMDIGTPERYLQACWDILGKDVETEAGSKLNGDGTYVAADADVDGGATIASLSFVDSDAVVATGATIGPRAVLGAGSSVGEGATDLRLRATSRLSYRSRRHGQRLDPRRRRDRRGGCRRPGGLDRGCGCDDHRQR